MQTSPSGLLDEDEAPDDDAEDEETPIIDEDEDADGDGDEDEDGDGGGDEDGDGSGDGVVPGLIDYEADERKARPQVSAGDPHPVDLDAWLTLGWIANDELRLLATSSAGQVLGTFSAQKRDDIIQHIQADEKGEDVVTQAVRQFPPESQWAQLVSLAEGEGRGEAAMQHVKAVLALRKPELVVPFVAHMERLGQLLTSALYEASSKPSSRWLKARENSHASLLLPLLSVQRLHDAAPPDVLRRLGRHTSVLQCTKEDAEFYSKKDMQMHGVDRLSLLNLNIAVISIIFICMPPLLDIAGVSPVAIDAVCRSVGHVYAWLMGWWVWCKRCKKWIFVWNLTGARIADLMRTHSAVINNPISLNLPLIYSLLRGMSLVSSRVPHDEVSMTRKLAYTAAELKRKLKRKRGLPHKPQVYPTCRTTSTGKPYLGYVIFVHSKERLVTAVLSDDLLEPERGQIQLLSAAQQTAFDAALAKETTLQQEMEAALQREDGEAAAALREQVTKHRAEQLPTDGKLPDQRLCFEAYPSHIAVWGLACWCPTMSRPLADLLLPGADLNVPDWLVPLTMAAVSTSASKDGKYPALPTAHKLALHEYWGQQQIFHMFAEAEVEKEAKEARAAKQLLPPASPEAEV